jgi:predicted deacetylase
MLRTHMINRSEASYLPRFDDICPRMRWSNWEAIEQILSEYDIKPILTVVPDNRDADLALEHANPNFWNRVRRWQAAGWAIGIHAFQHTYVARDPGLYSNRRASEFAGLPPRAQRAKSWNWRSPFFAVKE